MKKKPGLLKDKIHRYSCLQYPLFLQIILQISRMFNSSMSGGRKSIIKWINFKQNNIVLESNFSKCEVNKACKMESFDPCLLEQLWHQGIIPTVLGNARQYLPWHLIVWWLVMATRLDHSTRLTFTSFNGRCPWVGHWRADDLSRCSLTLNITPPPPPSHRLFFLSFSLFDYVYLSLFHFNTAHKGKSNNFEKAGNHNHDLNGILSELNKPHR